MPYFGWFKTELGGQEWLKNSYLTYIAATILGFIVYYLDKSHNLVCSMIFGYLNPYCKDLNPKLYEDAYRHKLH